MHDAIVLVEGKHDVKALEACGVRARFVLAIGKPESIAKRLEGFFESQAKTKPKRVLLMLDFDKEGARKQGFFKAFLEEQGFSADAVFARKLRALLGFTLVEEIESKFTDLKEKGEKHGKNVR